MRAHTRDSLQHYSLYIWIIASIRSGHMLIFGFDPVYTSLWGRDEVSTLNLFKNIFIEHDIWIKTLYLKQFYLNIPDYAQIFIKYRIKNHFGEVLTNIFYHGDVLTNLWGRFDQFGDVLTRGRLTWGRFDCNPLGQLRLDANSPC